VIFVMRSMVGVISGWLPFQNGILNQAATKKMAEVMIRRMSKAAF